MKFRAKSAKRFMDLRIVEALSVCNQLAAGNRIGFALVVYRAVETRIKHQYLYPFKKISVYLFLKVRAFVLFGVFLFATIYSVNKSSA